jgi:hypothetical protein
MPVRAPGDDAVDTGLAAYASGRYHDAARYLGGTPARTSAEKFYLGLSLLATGQAESALVLLEPLRHHPPYGDAASYYAAKAWLRLGRADSALPRAATSAQGQALADSIRATIP